MKLEDPKVILKLSCVDTITIVSAISAFPRPQRAATSSRTSKSATAIRSA